MKKFRLLIVAALLGAVLYLVQSRRTKPTQTTVPTKPTLSPKPTLATKPTVSAPATVVDEPADEPA